MARNDLDREYIYVRRLISMLTNDDSDKLIVEKLKGKNLTSLLYNAKIIDNSKNMTANKKILGCVIRAIEREKHLCHKSEQSWGRKFLNSFNCLYPGLKTEENHPEESIVSRGCGREHKSNHKVMKHRGLSKRMKTSSTRTPKTDCTNSFKSRCECSMRSTQKSTAEAEKLHLFKSKPSSYIYSVRNRTDSSCIDSVVTDKPDGKNDTLYKCEKLSQWVPVIYTSQKIMYETICPPLLQQKKLDCVLVYPGKPIPSMRPAEKAEKKSSSTQTSDICYEPDIRLPKVPNNIKLQDLLEAASNLINAHDQKEYVKTFLTNVEPPFDLSAGFPPYLKLPMKNSGDLVGKESVYGSNSELSLRSDSLSPTRQLQTNDVMKQKEDNVRRYVRDLASEPWQDTAESIISGVINETLPHDKADYSQLGACILKRLGAYPGSSSYKDTRYRRQNLNIPEIILQCTEFFESDAGDSDVKPEQTSRTVHVKNSSLDKSPPVELKLSDERDGVKPLDAQMMQNYCFLDSSSASTQKVGLLNLSESSLVDIGTSQGQNEVAAQGDASQDRKNLLLREPLKITPSGLEPGGKKPKRAGGFERRCENKVNAKIAESRRVPEMQNLIPELKIDDKESKTPGKSARQKVSIYTVTSDKKHGLSEGAKDPCDESALIESISIVKSESELITTNEKMEDKNKANTVDAENESLVKMPAGIIETETPPEPAILHWEPAEAEVETFDGIGEGQKTLTDLPATKPDKKIMPSKNRTPQGKTWSKKKCKAVSKKKPHSDKNGEGNCRVM